MNIVLIEALTFGLGRLVKAAESLKVNLTLLTYNPEIYKFELDKINSPNFKLITINTFDKQKIIEQCKKITNLQGIINLTDTWTNIATEVSEHFGFTGQNPISTKICRDKFSLRNTLHSHQLTRGTAKLIELSDYTSSNYNDLVNLKHPLIIKDPSGTASKNVWLAENSEELSNLLLRLQQENILEKVLLETYFTGTLYSAETISYQGETKLIAVSSRILSDMPDFMEKAVSLPLNIKLKSLAGIECWIKKILASISYTDGFAHTEFIVTQHGFEVVEVNPRLGGVQIGEALCQAFNYNFYKAFLEISLQKKPEVFEMELDASTYIAQVLIYAKQQGIFSHLDAKYINQDISTIYPYAFAGKEINQLNNQAACVAILFTKSDSTESALLDALAEVKQN